MIDSISRKVTAAQMGWLVSLNDCMYRARCVTLLTRYELQGKGVDRHLFALLCMAKRRTDVAVSAADNEAVASEEDGGATSPPPLSPQIPALFEDEAWRVLNHVILSTR